MGVVSNLVVKVSAQINDLQAGLNQANTHLSGFQHKMEGVGESAKMAGELIGLSFAASGLIHFGEEMLRMGEDIERAGKKTGLTTDEVQKLGYVATQTGTSFDTIIGAFQMLEQRLGKGGKDNPVVKSLNDMHISLKEFQAMSPYEAMVRISEGFSTIHEPARIAADSFGLFGKSWKEMAPVILSNMGAIGEAAPIMDEATVQALSHAEHALQGFKLSVRVWAAESYNFMVGFFDKMIVAGFKLEESVDRQLASIIDHVVSLASKIPGLSSALGVGGAAGLTVLSVASANFKKSAQAAHDSAGAMAFAIQKAGESATTAGVPIGRLGDHADKAGGAAKKAAEDWQKFNDKITGQSAIKSAEDWMKHVADVGGITHLTADATKELSATLERASEAYALLGKTAPDAMTRTWLATIQIPKLAPLTKLPGQQMGMPEIPLPPVPSVGSTSGILGSTLPGQQMGIPEIPKPPTAWLRDLSVSLRELSQISGGTFGNIINGLSGVVVALDAAARSNKQFSGSAGIASAMFSEEASASQKLAAAINTGAAIVGGALAAWSSSARDGSKAVGALHGAMSGAQAGAMFGPWGMAIGAAGGALMGFIHTLSAGRREVKDFAESFNTAAAGTGFDELHTKLMTLGDGVGEALWVKVTQGVKKGDKAGAQAVIGQIQDALAHAPVSLGTQASQAGFSTSAELQKTAQDAMRLYQFMRDSGQYSASVVEAAWKRANDAMIASGDSTAIAAQHAKDAIAGLTQQIDSLTQSIANEAPEAVMGRVEEETRAQIAGLEEQRAQAQAKVETLAQQSGDAVQAVVDRLNGQSIDIPVHFSMSGIDWPAVLRGQLPPGTIPSPRNEGFEAPEPDVPRYASGGIVRARAGGTLVTVGEGGRDEAIMPLPLSLGGAGGGVTIILERDGEREAEFLVPYIPGAVRRLGLS